MLRIECRVKPENKSVKRRGILSMTLAKNLFHTPISMPQTVKCLAALGFLSMASCTSLDDRLGDLSEMPSWQYDVPQAISQNWDVELRNQIGKKTPISTPKKGPIITECDQVAADPLDRHKTVSGTLIENISIRKAIRACGYIVDEYPDIERFKYQLARAMARGGKTEQALKMLTELAENNYVAAQDILGSLYLSRARSLNLPFDAAVKWMKKASENGSLSSQWLLATLIIQGAIDPVTLEDTRFAQTDLSQYKSKIETAQTTDKNTDDSEQNEAINEDDSDAEKSESKEVELSEEEKQKQKRQLQQKEGLKRLSQTARAGHPGAMRRIGELLLNSDSNYGNPGLGAKYLAAAAFKEEPEAQFLFSLLLKEGYGVSRDDEEAFEWLQKSSQWGHPLAQAMLSAEYLGMTWISEDPAKAYFWSSLSVKAGLEKSRPLQEVSGEKLSIPSRKSLDRFIQRWKPKADLPDFSTFTLVDGSLTSGIKDQENDADTEIAPQNDPEAEVDPEAEKLPENKVDEPELETESEIGSDTRNQTETVIEDTPISQDEAVFGVNNISDTETLQPILTKTSTIAQEESDTSQLQESTPPTSLTKLPDLSSPPKSKLEQLLEEVEKEYNLKTPE